ncbi:MULTISPECIES: VOC family protein [Rathayibacter]|nr:MULTISPECIES: VOC family protein [Rathayibacter]
MAADESTSRLVILGPRDFHAASGVADWRVLFWGAHCFYRTTSFAEAAAFVVGIAEVAERLDHAPDIDMRAEGVTVRTCSRPDGALSVADVDLAAAVSVVAHRLGLTSDPSMLQVVGIAVAQDAGIDTRPFWEAAFGYERVGEEDLLDPLRRGPHLWFHELRTPRPGRGRTHIDVSVPADEAEKRVQAAVTAGGRIVDASEAPKWWTLASPDNHGIDIAGWADWDG